MFLFSAHKFYILMSIPAFVTNEVISGCTDAFSQKKQNHWLFNEEFYQNKMKADNDFLNDVLRVVFQITALA